MFGSDCRVSRTRIDIRQIDKEKQRQGNRPENQRRYYSPNPFLIEAGKGIVYWKQQNACHHDKQGNTRTNQAINRISELNRSIELSTFDATAAEIQEFDCNFPVEDIARYTFGVMIPSCMELKECQEIQKSVLEKAKAMADQYRFDVSEYRDTVTASLPSKFNELKAIEEKRKTDAAEAARREQELKSKEDEERQKMEAERKAKEDKELQMKSMEHEQQAVAGMFSTAATTMATAPGKKVKIRKAVRVKNMKGYADLFTFWWVGEGQFMSAEELEKIFKKQFSYAEKQANSSTPEFIKSDNVEYVDDIKAK